MDPKRKCAEESKATTFISGGANTSGNFATRSSNPGAISSTPFSTEEEETSEAEIGRAIDAWICRAALVKNPAASRAALIQYHASIDIDLANMLECVGSFRKEVVYSEMWQHISASTCTLCFASHSYTIVFLQHGDTPLRISIWNEDLPMMQYLLAAGAVSSK